MSSNNSGLTLEETNEFKVIYSDAIKSLEESQLQLKEEEVVLLQLKTKYMKQSIEIHKSEASYEDLRKQIEVIEKELNFESDGMTEERKQNKKEEM